MPKISGLALGEIKKMSGLGLGTIKKVSGLGLGLIWQDAVSVGMYKNGDFDVTTTQQDVPSWLAQDANSTVALGNSLVIPSAGNWLLETNIVHAGTGFGTGSWLQIWIFRTGVEVAEGVQQGVSRPSTGNNYFLSTGTPVACAQNDLITVECDASSLSAVDITGGVNTWLRATPA